MERTQGFNRVAPPVRVESKAPIPDDVLGRSAGVERKQPRFEIAPNISQIVGERQADWVRSGAVVGRSIVVQ